jgi:GGDEF domain-containing protein
MMYQKGHPVIKESVDNVHRIADVIFYRMSPLVFILNRGQFFIDEEALDPRINVARIADLFKNVGIQSISFEKGLSANELIGFIGVFSKLTKASNVEDFKKSLINKGVFNIKINHVVYKKVTEDDQVVSRETLKKVTPMMSSDGSEGHKKVMDALLESVLSEELSKTLNISDLLNNPSAFSQDLVDADLAGTRRLADEGGREVRKGGVDGTGTLPIPEAENGDDTKKGGGEGSGTDTGSGKPMEEKKRPGGAIQKMAATLTTPTADKGAGTLLVHQLDLMQREVQRHIRGNNDMDLSDLAFAIFDMKKQLLENIQTQKALGVAYANEAAIIENADRLSDNVIIELIKDEYASGDISIARLAMIMRRLIPDAGDLKRLMPKIKVALLASGMSADVFLEFINELQNEFQSEELTRILKESSESIGMDGDALIAEFKRNPTQAAELIYLASEIRAGSQDTEALTSILVDYVEQLSGQMKQDKADTDPDAGESHVEKVVSEIETGLLRQLSRMDVNAETLASMESRINDRIETILDKMRIEWLQMQTEVEKNVSVQHLTVFQTLRNNVGDDEEMERILQAVHEKIKSGDIDENDFSQIYDEINWHKKRMNDGSFSEQLKTDILQSDELMFILDKEVAKACRYTTPISALAFSLVTAKPTIKTAKDVFLHAEAVAAVMDELADVFRDVDYYGQIGKNKMVIILPMTDTDGAKTALARGLKALHAEPIMVRGIPMKVRVAGIAETYKRAITPDARSFAKHLSNKLMDMVARVKSIQVLF